MWRIPWCLAAVSSCSPSGLSEAIWGVTSAPPQVARSSRPQQGRSRTAGSNPHGPPHKQGSPPSSLAAIAIARHGPLAVRNGHIINCVASSACFVFTILRRLIVVAIATIMMIMIHIIAIITTVLSLPLSVSNIDLPSFWQPCGPECQHSQSCAGRSPSMTGAPSLPASCWGSLHDRPPTQPAREL